jgi:hypothetical protein
MGSRDPDLTYRYTVDPETRMIVGDDSSTTEVALRIDPAKQRPGDVVWFGFPPAGHELAGRDMRVEFTAPGEAPPECFD